MFLSKQIRILSFTLILCIYFIAYLIQSQLLINWDVSWDILVSKRLLAGGTYTQDFFDLNPPLIFYLLAPAAILSKVTIMSTITALRFYIFFLASVSLACCYFLTRKIFREQDAAIRYAFLVTIAFVFLIPAEFDFGQREHLMLILSLPYLLTIVARLQGNSLHWLFALGVGLCAGLGFAIKPYFLLIPTLVELYYIVKTKNLFAWVRIETITLLLFLISYLVLIFIYYPDYIHFVVPLSAPFYYAGFSQPWSIVIFTAPVLACYLMLVFYLFHYTKNTYSILNHVLLLTCIGFLISYFFQRTFWNYHILPALAVGLLMFVEMFVYAIKNQQNRFWTSIFGLWVAWLICYSNYSVFQNGQFYKNNQKPLLTFLNQYAHK